MAHQTVETKFFEFDQNNSGGYFDRDDEIGLGPRVWIEALNKDDACARAAKLGIYFDGVESGQDCACCGDRWSAPWSDEGKTEPHIDDRYDFTWSDTVYVHLIDGTIQRVTQSDAAAA